MKPTAIIGLSTVGLIAVIGLVIVSTAYFQEDEAVMAVADQSVSADVQPPAKSPFATESGTDLASVQLGDSINTPDVNQATDTIFANSPRMSAEEAAQLWRSDLNEAQMLALLVKLRASPELVQVLIDEFRQELDPVAKRRIASILGELGGEQATQLASELIFSGNAESRALGLSLLQKIQPGNEQARDIVSGMLANEVEPVVLRGALSALSSTGDIDAQSQRYLADQVAWLVTHSDDGVRSVSLDILSRWSDGSHSEIFVGALDDSSPFVRASAAQSLANNASNGSPAAVDRLFQTLRDPDEPLRVKRASVQALQSMPLTSHQQDELQRLERQIRIDAGR